MANSHRDDSSESSEDLLRSDSEGWEDAELDEETLEIKDFFSDKIFPDAMSMIEYCAEKHDIDFLKLQKDFGGYVCLCEEAKVSSADNKNRP